jgi:mono/diheme cytochrome c family protein
MFRLHLQRNPGFQPGCPFHRILSHPTSDSTRGHRKKPIDSVSKILLLFAVFMLVSHRSAQAWDVKSLKDSVAKAGQHLKAGEISECVKIIDEATESFPKLIADANPNELSDLKTLHAKLTKAHELLEAKGSELSALATWDDLIAEHRPTGNSKKTKSKEDSRVSKKKPNAPAASEASGVSFTREIAPWLVEQCGRCHINEARGRFSMISYEALMKGTRDGVVVFAGDPVGSRLVETIETGDMPRGGGKVSPENLAKLKQWVTEGAKFDSARPAAPLASLVSSGTGTAGGPTPMKNETPAVSASTGKETVSFSRDIAPILVSNCNGCHYQGTRNSGGLRFDDFAGLLKGGDSGSPVEPSKPEESLLVRKLRGTSGARMPLGRAALSDETIELVATWIREGATFDGYNKDAKLDQVIGKAWASKATHTELMARRTQRARDKWKIVAPKTVPAEASDDLFHIIGDIGDENAKVLLMQANTALKQVRKMFKINGNEPIVKGGITIFAMKQRYDYSEFGKMAEGGRSLPPEWSSHWRKETLDTYIAMVFDKGENKINETSLVQQISSLWIGSMDGVPKWFADGAGRNALLLTAGQNDARVQPWLKRIPESMSHLENLKRFTEGSMNDEDVATLGFGIIRWMHDAKMKSQYDTIIRMLAAGGTFEQATNKAIGPIDVFLQRVTGKKK